MKVPRQNYGWQNGSLEHVRSKIARMEKVESAEITDIGAIKVIIKGGIDRAIREDILEVGKRAVLPVQVFYRMADGSVVGESKAKTEWVNDYYKNVNVPGFGGSAGAKPSEAPPEEVAAEPKGALKLRRVRASTRGRPVVAWRLGEEEVRVGTKIKFNKEAALQWSMGRTLNVRPGATAEVVQLASRRPMMFVKIGDSHTDVELPVHMMGHVFTTQKQVKESVDEAKKKSKLGGDFNRLMGAIGWGRDQDQDEVPGNSPAFVDRFTMRDQEFEEDADEEDVVIPNDDDEQEKPAPSQKVLIIDKR